MARGKYLSLEEARKKKGGLKRFVKEHPSKGDKHRFDRLLQAMALGAQSFDKGAPKKRDADKQK